MKKVFLILLIGIYPIFSQPLQLEWVNPKPTGSNLYNAVSLAPNSVTFFGVAGTIISSNDGLNTHQLNFFDQREDIWNVEFVTPLIGYACGENGLMLKTVDGGNYWFSQNTWVTSRLYDVEFINPDSGLTVGASGLVLKTSDGGNTWVTTYYQTSTNYTIHIVSPDLIFIGSAYSSGRLAKSTDFGTTWTPITAPELGSSVYSIFFVDQNTGFIGTASSGILKTTDGGTTFTVSYSTSNTIYDIELTHSQKLVAVDSKGKILITTDMGTTWSEYQTPAGRSLRTITTDGTNIYVGGEAGAIYKSSDGGSTWEQKFSYFGTALYFQRRVIFVNENLGYICGGSSSSADSLGYILKTTDGGETWTQLPYNFKTQLYAIAAPSENVIYTSAGSSLVFKSTDGGNTWTKYTVLATSTTWWDIQFYNDNNGFVVGSSGRIYKTIDGGATWTSVTSPFGTSTIYSLAILDSLTLVATGVSAKAYKSTDGGATWTALSPGIPGSYFITRFYQNIGYIGSYVSPSGYVSKSTDYGSTWTPLPFPGENSVWGIAVKDTSTVYVVDLYGYVFHSNDGGQTWIETPRIFGTNSFYCSLAGDKLFISGSNGAIIKGTPQPVTPPSIKTISHNAGWNIVSVPLQALDMRKSVLFPSAISPAYGYNGEYYSEDTLKMNKGYWLKFGESGVDSIVGYKAADYLLDLPAGWNLIGPFDLDVPVNQIATNPPAIFESEFFKYENGYKTTTVLEAGKGYWIKLIQPGTLIFPSTLSKSKPELSSVLIDQPYLMVKDANGNSANLYLVKNMKRKYSGDLPPTPPEGIIDVRFARDKFIEVFDESEKIIYLNSVSYPVTISSDKLEGIISDAIDGKIFSSILKSGNSVTITNSDIKILKFKPMNVVYNFELYQNYPNPFNPATVIKFSLPEKLDVKLQIYNSIGEVVKSFEEKGLDAGVHSFVFDANNLSSGVYIYSLDAGKFSSVKKMILMK